jgi:ribosomal protein S18 acetylase RimI-like enzyme
VGITINGIGNWKGKLTAYDSGTGIIKNYRKKGVASKMFNESLSILRKNNITQYLLEVIITNTAAVELYKKAGFKTIRKFDYFKSFKDELSYKSIMVPKDFQFKVLENPNWEILKSFWEFEPSWQNSIDSVKRKFDSFKILGVYNNSNLVGYGIIELHTGDIPQFAISKKYRRLKLGTILFRVLINYTETQEIRIINSDMEYIPFRKFAENIGLIPGDGQYEMLMKL